MIYTWLWVFPGCTGQIFCSDLSNKWRHFLPWLRRFETYNLYPFIQVLNNSPLLNRISSGKRCPLTTSNLFLGLCYRYLNTLSVPLLKLHFLTFVESWGLLRHVTSQSPKIPSRTILISMVNTPSLSGRFHFFPVTSTLLSFQCHYICLSPPKQESQVRQGRHTPHLLKTRVL